MDEQGSSGRVDGEKRPTRGQRWGMVRMEADGSMVMVRRRDLRRREGDIVGRFFQSGSDLGRGSLQAVKGGDGPWSW